MEESQNLQWDTNVFPICGHILERSTEGTALAPVPSNPQTNSSSTKSVDGFEFIAKAILKRDHSASHPLLPLEPFSTQSQLGRTCMGHRIHTLSFNFETPCFTEQARTKMTITRPSDSLIYLFLWFIHLLAHFYNLCLRICNWLFFSILHIFERQSSL